MEGRVTDLAAYKRMFSEAMDLGTETRNRSLTAERYYHKKQLTPGEIAALRRRRQPDIVINRVRPAVNGTLGVLQQGRTDPKAWPRTPNDEQSSDVVTKTLRFIADYNDFDDIRVKVARDFLVQHAMAVIIEIDEKKRVLCNEIAPEEFFFDPHSKREDFRDARYMGIAKWSYADDIAALYPDHKQDIESTIETGMPVDQALEDRPVGGRVAWVDRRRRRLLTVEIYHREGGQWTKCVFHSGGILEAGVSPYLDDDKKPANPIIAQTCYVDDENVRYGVVFDMLDLQDEVNKRRSKALHLATMRQIRIDRAAGMDKEEARREAAKPDGIFEAEAGEIEVLNNNDQQASHYQMMLQAMAEMDRNSPNPALIGRATGDQSGRALQTRQQAGLTELAIVFGGIENWERRVYRQMWNTAKQYWTGPDYVRVTDDEGAPQFIGVNQPIMGPAQVVMGEGGMPQLQPTILGYENALAEMNVDIKLDSVPDTATLQQEQFDKLAELAKLYGPQEVPFDDMLLLSSITDKQKLIERRKQRQEQQGQQGQMGQQIQMMGAQAEIENTQADTEKKRADTALSYAKAQAADPAAQMEMEREKIAAGHMMDMQGQQHAQGLAEERQGHAMMMAERKQQFSEHMAAQRPAAGDTGASARG